MSKSAFSVPNPEDIIKERKNKNLVIGLNLSPFSYVYGPNLQRTEVINSK